MHVLDAILNLELTTFANLIDVLQLGQQQGQFVLANESDGFQHGDMGHRAQHVVLGQIEVHLAVTTNGEALNLGIHLEVFFPKLVCHNYYFLEILDCLDGLDKRNLRQGVSDFLHTVLQGTSNHSLEHKGDVGFDGDLHLAGLSGDG